MACRRLQCSRWLLTISVVSVLLGLLMAPRLLVRAAAAETLVTTDYWVSHTSSESFYAQYKLDPQVVLHVREVVLAGRERTYQGRESGALAAWRHRARFCGV